jgi:hypothetical protein
MADLIDRAALSKLFEERFLYLKGASEKPLSGGHVLIDREIQTGAIIAKEFLDHVRKAPAVDAVPVVRCKDCNHWEEIKHGYGWCCASTPNHALTKDDDYCSYGERRTDATDRC